MSDKEFIIAMLIAFSPWIVFLLLVTGLAEKESTFICHPDVYESMIEAAKMEYPETSKELNTILGLKVLILSSAPKDTIYLLSKDAVDRLMKETKADKWAKEVEEIAL